MPLPSFLPPMLAKLGDAFDSEDHLFEVKWDGMRVLAFVEEDGVRLLNRNERDVAPRFAELESLAALPAGTLLDGELVAMTDGKPDFHKLMSREHARDPRRIEALRRSIPIQYVVFDLPYLGFESICAAPLSERRERLGEVLDAAGDPRLVLSDGVVGPGKTLFEQVASQGIEGVVAKRLDSPYRPGKRTDDWTKIKSTQLIHCVILGWLEEDGELICVGRVGSGLGAAARADLLPKLRDRRRDAPLIDCGPDGNWVEPSLFCIVSFLERTRDGLRAPVFVELLGEES